MTALWPPVLAVCGYSGSGKTTLIVQMARALGSEGLAVAALKHTAGELTVDREGKDTWRLFAAGADVVACDPKQSFARRHGSPSPEEAARLVGAGYDLVLVEGHKHSAVPMLWLSSAAGPDPPAGARVIELLAPGPGRPDAALAAARRFLAEHHARLPAAAGILIGGRSRRMGQPKALLPWGGRTLAEHAVDLARRRFQEVLLLGDGPLPDSLSALPRLPDVPGAAGPAAGIAAAFRWAPDRRWLILPVDCPRMTPQAVDLLLSHCGPGRWAIAAKLAGRQTPEPLGAVYDPPMGPIFERLLERGVFSVHAALEQAGQRVRIVPVDGPLAEAWSDCNEPAGYQAALRARRPRGAT